MMTRSTFEVRLSNLRTRYSYLFLGTTVLNAAPGWLQILEELCDEIDSALPDKDRARFRLKEIYEKYGQMRIDVEGDCPNAVHEIIERAAEQSLKTCRVCGGPGSVRGDSDSDVDWLYVACDEHSESVSMFADEARVSSSIIERSGSEAYPRFLDFEASSLGPGSYPTEVAWSDPAGIVESHLIDPSVIDDWMDWDPGAQAATGISRELLRTDGCSPAWVVARMNKELAGAVLYVDGNPYDLMWRDRLFSAVGVEPLFLLRESDLLFSSMLPAQQWSLTDLLLARPSGMGVLDRLKARSLEIAEAKGYRRHRAANDVHYLLTLYRMLRGELS